MKQEKAVRQLKKIQQLIKGKKMRLAAEWPKPWQVLISTILSAQTRDEVTIPVCEELFKKYPSMKQLAKAKPKDVENIISRINYKKTKTQRIIKTAQLLQRKKVPTNIEELLRLPGVGRKVANVYLTEAHKKNAIGVDTHVQRISKKLGWATTNNTHKTEKELEQLFPKQHWKKINETLVVFGKTYGLKKKVEDEILTTLKHQA